MDDRAHLALAGIGMALVAALPGPSITCTRSRRTAQRRATRHAAVNLTAVALFALVWWIRGAADMAPDPVILAIEAVGVGLLTASGWMGGVLVNRNQIGVDPRYARAGKWKEATLRAQSGQSIAGAGRYSVDALLRGRVDDVPRRGI